MSKPDDAKIDEEFRRELRARTRRGFAVSAAALAAGAAGWTAFVRSPNTGHINHVMRRALDLHERVGRAMFRSSSRAGEHPVSQAEEPVVYGSLGMYSKLDIANWRLSTTGVDRNPRSYDFAQLFKLPRVEMTTEIRCVEGWSTVVHWSGVRLRDFASATGIASRSSRPGDVLTRRRDALRYVSASTMDGGYYVGLDIESALHMQTLLCDRMNGKPLDEGHGAPLRLVIPTKYGFKSLKRLGSLQFLDERPADYWAEFGYDWYAGL